MTVDLSPEDKLPIVEQHLKQLLFSQYNITLSLMEVNASTNPDATMITNLNTQMTQVNGQIASLQTEYNSVNAAITAATPSN
jgi:hypothetical protein